MLVPPPPPPPHTHTCTCTYTCTCAHTHWHKSRDLTEACLTLTNILKLLLGTQFSSTPPPNLHSHHSKIQCCTMTCGHEFGKQQSLLYTVTVEHHSLAVWYTFISTLSTFSPNPNLFFFFPNDIDFGFFFNQSHKYAHKHTHVCMHTCAHTLAHTHILTHSLSVYLTHSFTLTHSRSLTHSLTRKKHCQMIHWM